MISIIDFPCVAKKYRTMIKDFYFIFGYSQLWLRLPKDDNNFFTNSYDLHILYDCHLGYKQKIMSGP
jgi:hypothetical protein